MEKESKQSAAGSEPYGYKSKNPIRIASEVSVNIEAPTVSIDANTINITGDLNITGSLKVNGVSVT